MPPLDPRFPLFIVGAWLFYWGLADARRPLGMLAISVLLLGSWGPGAALVVVLLGGAGWLLRRWPRWAVIVMAAGFLSVQVQREFASTPLVPVGLGFWLPAAIQWIVEGRAGDLATFARYLLLFPAFAGGPIHGPEAFFRDERRIRWDRARFVAGVERVIRGYAMVVILGGFVVGGQLAPLAAVWIPEGTRMDVVAECFLFGIRLFLDFAGYSSIAIGLAATFGYTLPENFDAPWRARSLSDFWMRWHQSLTNWCRQFVYLPLISLGRSRVLAVAGALLFISLWHEVTVRYVLWGAYNAAGLGVTHAARLRGWRVPVPVGRVLTLGFVFSGFVFTKNLGWTGIEHDLRVLVCGAP